MRKLILASFTISSTLSGQAPVPRTTPLRGPLERRLATLLDQPPFDRANWGVYVGRLAARALGRESFALPDPNLYAARALAAALLRKGTAVEGEDGEHLPGEHPLRLPRARRRPAGHVQHPGEQPRGAVATDAGADRLDGGGDRQDPVTVQSSFCPNIAMFDECPGSIFAAGLMKCTAWFTAMLASATPVAMSLSLPG